MDEATTEASDDISGDDPQRHRYLYLENDAVAESCDITSRFQRELYFLRALGMGPGVALSQDGDVRTSTSAINHVALEAALPVETKSWDQTTLRRPDGMVHRPPPGRESGRRACQRARRR